MKITLIYLIFCIILLYIYWYYTKLNHAEKCKQTKLMQAISEKHTDNYVLIEELQKKIIPVKKEVIKKTNKKKK